MSAAEPAGLPFRHDNRTRGPANLLLLVGVIVLTGATMLIKAGLLLLILAVASLAGLVYLKLFAPRAGIEIDAGTLAFWHGRQRETVPLAEIDHVAIRPGAGNAGATVHRRDGRTLEVPARCLPEPGALAAALERAGVRVSAD